MGEARTILIVDDEDVVRQVAKAMLTRLGYHVLVSSTGEDALRFARDPACRIDGVLLDLTMPHMSGREVFDELRKTRSELPVVITSGFTQTPESDAMLREPKVGFVGKPYTMEELASIVGNIVGSDAP